jgi:hypothetical protein
MPIENLLIGNIPNPVIYKSTCSLTAVNNQNLNLMYLTSPQKVKVNEQGRINFI